MKNNLIREKVDQRLPMTSTRIWSTNPFIVETVGCSQQFDYVEFAAEYAPFSQVDLENMCRAAELYGMGSMIKLDLQNRGYVAQKAMAAGFQAVLFADHSTPEQIEEICSVPGVDMIQFGPSDYSMSAGKDRSSYTEEAKAAERAVIEVALKHGVHPRCEIMTADAAQYYIDLGVRHFSLGDQLKIQMAYWDNEGKKIRGIADGLK